MEVSESKLVERAKVSLVLKTVTSTNLHSNNIGEVAKAMVSLDAYKMPGTAHACFPDILIYFHSSYEAASIWVLLCSWGSGMLSSWPKVTQLGDGRPRA